MNWLFALALVTTYIGTWSLAVAMTRKPRLMLLRATATTLVLVAVIAMLEMPAKLKLVHWALVIHALSGEGTGHGTGFMLDPELSFRRIPNLRWSGRPSSDIESAYGLPRSLHRRISFAYDRWGYRNAAEMQTADIVLLGDSFVEGWYVSDDETVAARLAAHTGRAVANLGVAGYGTMQQHRVLRTDALARKPRVIAWFFFEGNDLYDDQSFENALLWKQPATSAGAVRRRDLARDDGWRKRSFLINGFRWLRRRSHPVVPNRAPYWAWFPKSESASERVYFFNYGAVPWTAYEADRWQKAQTEIRDGIAFARGHGIQVVLVYVPTKYRVYRDFVRLPDGSPMAGWNVWHTLPGEFNTFCRAVAASCLDLTEPLKDAASRGTNVYAANDTHWAPAGHQVVAAALEQTLREARIDY